MLENRSKVVRVEPRESLEVGISHCSRCRISPDSFRSNRSGFRRRGGSGIPTALIHLDRDRDVASARERIQPAFHPISRNDGSVVFCRVVVNSMDSYLCKSDNSCVDSGLAHAALKSTHTHTPPPFSRLGRPNRMPGLTRGAVSVPLLLASI